MKMIRMNFASVLLLLVIAAVVLGLPSLMLQSLWNTAFERSLERDLSITLWQAALLWGAVLSLIYMSGIFKLQVDFRTIENIDLSDIDDPELRAEIEKIKSINKELRSQEVTKPSQEQRKSE